LCRDSVNRAVVVRILQLTRLLIAGGETVVTPTATDQKAFPKGTEKKTTISATETE
ncbi:hypothetical protein M9458_016687, partial [Cirrhinus mrigala]